jgi:DNA topoisomerase IB
MAAVALAVAGPAAGTKTGRKRAITRAVKEVAYHLGNTPAVARASYIDPRVFDRYRDGTVIAVHDLDHDEDGTAIQGEIEEAVLDLITGNGHRSTPGLDRVEAIEKVAA